jgi:tetratricopeptide (TPR) repeat protein
LQAVDMFARAIVNDPTLHEARLERAQVLQELDREEEAAADFHAYLRGVPGDAAAKRAYLTLLLYRLGRVSEALELLDELEKEHPDSLSLRMDRAAAQWLAGKPREAVASYLRVLEEDPRCARAALNIGYLYFEVLPSDEVSRRRFWPRARAAFRLFLDCTEPADGHEQFEETLGVPYRLATIEELLGPAAKQEVKLEDLRWPEG